MTKQSTSTDTSTTPHTTPNTSTTPHTTPNTPRSVEDLEVFKLAHELALKVYELSRRFPSDERFGLTAQVRRAAASIPANLSEGAGRLHRAEYRHFVGIAKGSAAEVGYHLLLARDLGHIPDEPYQTMRGGYDSVGRMLTRLAQALK